VGLSGGTDSTYVLYQAVKMGLRPLAVNFDNGWNSAIAVSNIRKATDSLGVDLYTYVINWEEFKDLQ
jgi:tRNA(Ile)-lysidine synthase TilS/MesJ